LYQAGQFRVVGGVCKAERLSVFGDRSGRLFCPARLFPKLKWASARSGLSLSTARSLRFGVGEPALPVQRGTQIVPGVGIGGLEHYGNREVLGRLVKASHAQ